MRIAAEVGANGPWTATDSSRGISKERWSDAGARILEAQILEHTSLVARIARQLARRMPPNIEVDDLIQAGMVGLLEAAQRYEASGSASFETYARFRIRGAILDFARKIDWRPRPLQRRIQSINAARRRIESETAKITTSAAEVATALDVSLQSYHRTLQDSETSKLLSLDDSGSPNTPRVSDKVIDTSRNPADEVEREELRHAVAAAIDTLPDNERLILLLYYDEEYLLREIGERLDLSESRICQLRGRAVKRLRQLVQRWMACGGFAQPLLHPGPVPSSRNAEAAT